MVSIIGDGGHIEGTKRLVTVGTVEVQGGWPRVERLGAQALPSTGAVQADTVDMHHHRLRAAQNLAILIEYGYF